MASGRGVNDGRRDGKDGKKKEKSWTYLESVRESGVMMLQINFTHGTRSTSIT